MRRSMFTAVLLVPWVAWAQSPTIIGYQGRILDASGVPQTGPLNLGFAIYDAPSAGHLIWCESQSVTLADGYYSVDLGEGGSCSTSGSAASLAAAFASPSRFLEISVAGSPLSPRQRIPSVPFAYVADSLSDGGASFIWNQTASSQPAGFRISGSSYITGPAPFTGTGTVATVSGSATVTGIGTAFDREVTVGDLITIKVPASQSQHVVKIDDATHLTVDGNWTGTTNNLNFQIQKVVSQLNSYSSSASTPPAFVVNQAGNVGVGTSNPRGKLEVAGAGATLLIGRSGPMWENWWEFGVDDGKTGTGIDFHGGATDPYTDYTARLYRLAGDKADFRVVNRGGSIQMQTNDSDRLTVAEGGNVGIGTTNPVQLLHVAGRAYFESAGVGINTDWSGYPSITVYHHRLDGADNATTYPEFRIHGSPDTFMGSNSADWSVGLRVDGGVLSSSDRRRKTNIEIVPNALQKILALRGTRFNTITPAGEIETNRNSMASDSRRLGFIAQEVAEVVPEAVNYYPEEDKPNHVGFANAYSVDYGALTALLVEAAKSLASQHQELQQKADRCSQKGDLLTSHVHDLTSAIATQQKKIDAQQARLEVQEAQIARLEELVARLGTRR